jgi:hypothetical protein
VPSFRSVNFSGIRPTFESPFPLPNLIEFHLYLGESAGPFRISALLRFFSSSPRLQKIHVNTYNEMLQDIDLDQVIPLESLEELEWSSYKPAGRIVPHLRLPRIKSLGVCFPLQANKVERLADFLPSDGIIYLSPKGRAHSR